MDEVEGKKSKPTYQPPGWLVYTIGYFTIDIELAKKLEAFRWRRVAKYGVYDPRCSIKAVLTEGFEMLLLAETNETAGESKDEAEKVVDETKDDVRMYWEQKAAERLRK